MIGNVHLNLESLALRARSEISGSALRIFYRLRIKSKIADQPHGQARCQKQFLDEGDGYEKIKNYFTTFD